MKRTLSIIVFLLITISSCAAPTPAAPTPSLTSTLTALPSATIEPTDTPEPTLTISPSNTPLPLNGSPTPSVPAVLSLDGKEVQCYSGPGIEYQPSYTFKAAEIVGKDKTGAWWYIQMYDKQGNILYCWANAKDVGTTGVLSSVPVTEAERASVTAVNISIEGNSALEIACGQDIAQVDFHFTGEITADGPVDKLRYQWVTDSGSKFPPEQTQILAWDAPAQVTLTISVPTQEGVYSLTLRTISPNEMVRVVEFSVKCR